MWSCGEPIIPVRLRLWRRGSEWLKRKPPGKATSPVVTSKSHIWPACAPGQGDGGICFGGAVVTLWCPKVDGEGHPVVGRLLEFGPFQSSRQRFFSLCGEQANPYAVLRQEEWDSGVEE